MISLRFIRNLCRGRSFHSSNRVCGVKTHDLGHFSFSEGMSLPNAHIAYQTYGSLNAKKDNVIVYPTWYSGLHSDNEWLIGQGMALDPKKYFIIIPCLFGNGQSSSPSNTPFPYNGPRFPKALLIDNINAQHRLVTEVFGIERIKLVVGWSMGAQQTFQWAAAFPNMVERIAPFCGSAKTSVHNYVFLEGPKNALKTDGNLEDGWYNSDVDPNTYCNVDSIKHPVQRGLRAFGRVYSGWGFSQTFYREELHKTLGYESIDDFLVGFWEGYFLQKDPNNLLSMLWSWQNGDISRTPVYKGDFVKALNSITARAYVMPGSTDLYFPPEDSMFEVANMPNAKLVTIESDWGHWAGGPGTNPVDVKFIDEQLKKLLLEPSPLD